MTAFLMIVLYVVMSTGQPKLETKVFRDGPACKAAADVRAATLELDDGVYIVTAGCLSGIPVKEARK